MNVPFRLSPAYAQCYGADTGTFWRELVKRLRLQIHFLYKLSAKFNFDVPYIFT